MCLGKNTQINSFEYLNLEMPRKITLDKQMETKSKRRKLYNKKQIKSRLNYLDLAEIFMKSKNKSMIKNNENLKHIHLRSKDNYVQKFLPYEKLTIQRQKGLDNRKRTIYSRNRNITNKFLGKLSTLKINDIHREINTNLFGYQVGGKKEYVTYSEQLNKIMIKSGKIPELLENNPKEYIRQNSIKPGKDWETKNIIYVKNSDKDLKFEYPIIQIRRVLKKKRVSHIKHKVNLITFSARDCYLLDQMDKEYEKLKNSNFEEEMLSIHPPGLSPSSLQTDQNRMVSEKNNLYKKNYFEQMKYQAIKQAKRRIFACKEIIQRNINIKEMKENLIRLTMISFMVILIYIIDFKRIYLYTKSIDPEILIKLFLYALGYFIGYVIIRIVKRFSNKPKLQLKVEKFQKKQKLKRKRINNKNFKANKTRMKSSQNQREKNSNINIIGVKGIKQFNFPIYHETTQLEFELDTGSHYNLMSKQYCEKMIPNYKDYFYKKNNVTLVSASQNPLKIENIYSIPFYLPDYGSIQLNVKLSLNTDENLFILGRQFMLHTSAILRVNKNTKKVELKFCEGKIPNLRMDQEIKLDAFESKIYVGTIQNIEKNIKYEVKNGKNLPFSIKTINQIDDKMFVEIKNLLNIPVSHQLQAASLIELPEEQAEKLDQVSNQHCGAEKELDQVSNQHCGAEVRTCTSGFRHLLHLGYQSGRAKIKNYMLKIKSKILQTTNKDNNINEEENLKEEKDIVDKFNERSEKNSGIDISQLLEIKNLSVIEIAELMKTGNKEGNMIIAQYLHDLELYSKHTFDCGKLNDMIPKLTVKTKNNIIKNTKPYNLTPEDQQHVTNFFNLLLEYKLVEIAPADQSYGAPIFTIKTRSDGSNLPRIIADMRHANASILTNCQATLPDYRQLLEKLITKAKWITSFDLKKCYYSIPLSEESKNTGIFNVILPTGVYRFNVAITGLNVVPAYLIQTMLRFMHLDEFDKNDYIHDLLIFMDDIIITSDGNLEDHLVKVKKVLRRLKRIGVKISPEKAATCIFVDNGEIELLGYKIKNRKFCIPEKKQNGITKMTAPNNLKKLQAFLGKLNYYRNLLPLRIHEAINILYKKLSPYTFDSQLIEKFEFIRDYLLNSITEIDTIQPNSVNVLFSDSSFYSEGGVLLNVQMDKACESYEIESYEFNKIKNENEKIKFISCKQNFIECIFDTLTKLNYLTTATNDLQSYLNLTFIYAQLHDFKGFYEIKENENDLDALKRLQYKLFNLKYEDITYEYLKNNPIELAYILIGITELSSCNVAVLESTEPAEKVLVGSSNRPEIVIYYDCQEEKFYSLNIIKSERFQKTKIHFSPELMDKQSFKEYFLRFIKKNTYEENKKNVKIIGYFSKAVNKGTLQKLGISYLEILALYDSLVHFEHYIMNRITYCLIDSSVVTSILNNKKLSKKSNKLDNLSARILSWFGKEKIFFLHCTDRENLADIFSRLCDENTDTFTEKFKPYYEDNNICITPLKHQPRIKEKSTEQAKSRITQRKPLLDIRQIKLIKEIEPRIKVDNVLEFMTAPNLGQFMRNKFSEIMKTEDFIQMQLQEKNCPDQNPTNIKYINNKILLPQKLYLPIISLFHYSLGHLGERRLKNYIKNNYHMNNIKYANLICENLSNACLGCIINKQTNYKFKEGSANFIKCSRPNQTIYADLLEFPTFEGHTRKKSGRPSAILVVKCVYSGYISLRILQEKTSQELKNHLASYFLDHDLPHFLVTDNATIFKSHLFLKYIKGLGIRVLHSSALKSKSRGFIEIAVKRINYMLRMYRDIEILDVHHIVSIIGYMLNHIPYKNQKFSPNNLFNMSYKGLDGKNKEAGQYIFEPGFTIEQEMEKYYEKFKEMVMNCREEILKDRNKVMIKKNEKRNEHKFKVKDLVVIKTFDNSYEKKYKPIYGTILFEIIKVKSYTLVLQSTISGQLIYRHATDVKLINFEKLSKLKIPNYLSDLFNMVNLDNLQKVFNIPDLTTTRSRLKIKIEEAKQAYLNESSSSEEENVFNNTLPTIIEEEI